MLDQQEQVLAREEQVVGDVKSDSSKPTVWSEQLTQEYYYGIAQKLKIEKNKYYESRNHYKIKLCSFLCYYISRRLLKIDTVL